MRCDYNSHFDKINMKKEKYIIRDYAGNYFIKKYDILKHLISDCS